MIIEDVISAVNDRRSPVLLTERREHIELLTDRLSAFVSNIIVLKRGIVVRQRRLVAEKIAAILI